MNNEEEPKKRWKTPRKIKGLGDVIELIAQPIAKGIDKVLNTEIQHCLTCKERRDLLNKLFPTDKE